MELVIFTALGMCTLVALAALRRPVPGAAARPQAAGRTGDAVTASSPPRIINPARANRPDVQAWILRACPQCELTHSLLHNHRFSSEAAPPLPTIGCRLTDCNCRYDAILSGARRTDRREQGERRGSFRFEARTDRRRRNERREDGWGATLVR
jgi:hypothetical protein